MLLILLKSAACLAILMVFYKLFLEQLSIHNFKRFYLLGALLVSAIIPFITFIKYVEPTFDVPYFNVDHSVPLDLLPLEEPIVQEPINYLPIILWSFYGLGVLLFGAKFCLNLFGIVLRINKNEKQRHGNFISVLLNDFIVPHTFFSYIFLNKTRFEANAIPQEVLLHEQTHAKQKHSLDILFIELLQVVFWFNPLLYFIKKDIKLNHEFLADEAVLKQGIDSSAYQETLLLFTSSANGIPLAHAINYSLIKKRFTIMKTQTSKKAVWLRSLLLLPLLGGLLFSFSSIKEVEKDVVPLLKVSETPQQLLDSEKHNNNNNDNNVLTDVKSELEKINHLKVNYSDPKEKKPSKAQFEGWKNESLFALWLDGKHIRNSQLNNMSNEDIYYYNGLLIKLEARNDKFPQPYQTHLYTKNGFNKAYKMPTGEHEAKFKEIVDKAIEDNQVLINDLKNDQKPILTINGIVCDRCELNLSKKGAEKMTLATTTGGNILSFKVKFPGKPTVSIKGDGLNEEAVTNLNASKLGTVVQLFDIITVKKHKLPPVVIKLVDKNAKNYSKSPIVVKGEKSSLPPPPPPSKETILKDAYGFSIYMKQMERNGDAIFYNKKKVTAEEAIAIYKKYGKIDILTERITRGKYRVNLSKAKGKTSTLESIDLSKNPPPPPAPLVKDLKERKTGYININGEAHYFVNNEKGTTYYNRWGNKVDKNGNKLTHTQTDGSKVIPGQKITKVYKDGKVVSEFKKTWSDEANETLPPPPPAPKSPIDQVVLMAKKGADFYYNTEKISSDKAIEILKNNSKLNMSMHTNNGKSTVHLSNKPISVVNGRAVISQKNKELIKERKKLVKARDKKNRELIAQRNELVKARDLKAKEAMEKRRAIADKRMKEVKERKSIRRPLAEQFKGMEVNGTTFFYEGDKISEAKAIALIKENPKLNVSMHNNNGVGTVHLSKKGISTVNGKLVKKEK